MKKILFVVILLFFGVVASVYAKEKSFALTVDPPDAVIKVTSGKNLGVQQYRSPAQIKVVVPDDRNLAKKSVVTITRDRFKPAVIPLSSIMHGEHLKIRLEKDSRSKLKFRMVSPTQSHEIRIQDKNVSVRLDVDDQQMRMIVTNQSPYSVNIVWQRVQYTDVNGRAHRVIHPGIKYEDRNRAYAFQTILPYQSLEQPMIPVEDASYDDQKRAFAGRPLFAVEAAAGLKNRTFEVLIPIDIGDTIVPYNFKVKILGLAKN